MDTDRDGIVSFNEFMGYTEQKDKFETDEDWKAVVDEGIFSDKELEEFEESYDQYYEYDYGDDEFKTQFHEVEEKEEPREEGDPGKVEEEPARVQGPGEGQEEAAGEEKEEPQPAADQEGINVEGLLAESSSRRPFLCV